MIGSEKRSMSGLCENNIVMQKHHLLHRSIEII